jgi:hypothetical protein
MFRPFTLLAAACALAAFTRGIVIDTDTFGTDAPTFSRAMKTCFEQVRLKCNLLITYNITNQKKYFEVVEAAAKA